ncbi:MAG: glycosyltransferase family 4 protein [Anaerolineales bacterium]|nr:glycosyltransferase family 4 protein [Anaerolineales bacterium]
MTALRLLLISHTYSAPINHAKLEALARRVSLTVITPHMWRDALFTVVADRPLSSAYQWHRLPVHLNGRLMYHVYSLRALDRLIQQTRPDVVHVEEEPPSLALAELALLKPRRRYKLTCFTWENIPRSAGLPGVEAFNLRRCDGIIAGNREAEGVVRRKGFSGPMQVIPQLGVDAGLFRPAAQPAEGRADFCVGFIGRMAEEKGVRTLLAAARELRGVRLMLVGGGPLASEIRTWAARHEMAGRVEHIAPVSHEAVPHYLRQMDCLVLPSRSTPKWKEQFGHVLIEAMACGVPVIGSNSGAIPEVIAEAGLIFPEGDARALGAAIERLRDDPALRLRLGRAGRERVLAHYTHDRIAAATAEFLEQISAA